MKDYRGYNKETVLEAIKDSRGIVSRISKKLDCEWHTAKKYIEKWEITKTHYDNENQKILDVAEDRLIGAIDIGEQWDIKFMLATKGRNRGYVERQEIAPTDPSGQYPFSFCDLVKAINENKR